jgi:hypothetical protein
MPIRSTRPGGAPYWVVAIGCAAALAISGGRSRRPLFGLLDSYPLGIGGLGWVGIAVALGFSYWLLRSFRGEIAPALDEPTIALHLSDAHLTTVDDGAKEKGPGA